MPMPWALPTRLRVSEMWQFIVVILIAIAVFATTWLVVSTLVIWLDRRSRQRTQRIERELAKTQKRLAALSQMQSTLLNAGAHEAAVALILASYRVSKETCETAATSIVANSTTTSGGSLKGSPN